MSKEKDDKERQEKKDIGYIKRFFAKSIAVASLAVLGYASTYNVNESEHAIVTTFGDPSRVILNPIKELTPAEKMTKIREDYEKKGINVSEGAGFGFKWPWQSVKKIDRRFGVWETGAPEEISTKDKTYVFVEVSSPWRVDDPLLFQTSVQGSDLAATARIDTTIDSIVRDTINNTPLVDIVRNDNRPMTFVTDVSQLEKAAQESSPSQQTNMKMERVTIGRQKVSENIETRAKNECAQYGILTGELFMTRVEYVDSVKLKIEDRMSSERLMTAEKLISAGEGEYSRILGEKEREVSKTISEARKNAAIIKGNADAESIKILAEGYREIDNETKQEKVYRGLNADPAFYQFATTLKLYEAMARNGQNVSIVLGTDNPLLRGIKGEGILKESNK